MGLGCTFRLLFWFLGCRNPGQDSSSRRIPAESGRNIPDVTPFLRARTLLPFWTGKRSGLLFDWNLLIYMRRTFQLSACERKLFPATSKNDTEHIHRTQHHQQQERTLAIQLLHHEYGAPQHHPSMPPTKATGGIKKNAVDTPPQHHCQCRSARGPIWAGERAAAPFYEVRILGEIWPAGGLIPWPNRNGRT